MRPFVWKCDCKYPFSNDVPSCEIRKCKHDYDWLFLITIWSDECFRLPAFFSNVKSVMTLVCFKMKSFCFILSGCMLRCGKREEIKLINYKSVHFSGISRVLWSGFIRLSWFEIIKLSWIICFFSLWFSSYSVLRKIFLSILKSFSGYVSVRTQGSDQGVWHFLSVFSLALYPPPSPSPTSLNCKILQVHWNVRSHNAPQKAEHQALLYFLTGNNVIVSKKKKKKNLPANFIYSLLLL